MSSFWDEWRAGCLGRGDGGGEEGERFGAYGFVGGGFGDGCGGGVTVSGVRNGVLVGAIATVSSVRCRGGGARLCGVLICVPPTPSPSH